MVVGEKLLGGMMKNIRPTTLTILDSNGVEARAIISLSGHRSVSPLQSYCKTSDSRKRDMSNILSNAVTGCSSQKKSVAQQLWVFEAVKKLNK